MAAAAAERAHTANGVIALVTTAALAAPAPTTLLIKLQIALLIVIGNNEARCLYTCMQ